MRFWQSRSPVPVRSAPTVLDLGLTPKTKPLEVQSQTLGLRTHPVPLAEHHLKPPLPPRKARNTTDNKGCQPPTTTEPPSVHPTLTTLTPPNHPPFTQPQSTRHDRPIPPKGSVRPPIPPFRQPRPLSGNQLPSIPPRLRTTRNRHVDPTSPLLTTPPSPIPFASRRLLRSRRTTRRQHLDDTSPRTLSLTATRSGGNIQKAPVADYAPLCPGLPWRLRAKYRQPLTLNGRPPGCPPPVSSKVAAIHRGGAALRALLSPRGPCPWSRNDHRPLRLRSGDHGHGPSSFESPLKRLRG